MPAKDSRIFLNVLLSLFLGLFILAVSGYMAPLVLALVLAGITAPLYKWLVRLSKRENLAALISVLVVFLVIVLPSVFLLTLLATEAVNLFTSIQEGGFLENYSFQNALSSLSDKFGVDLRSVLETQLAPALKNIGLTISKEVGGILSNIVSLTINFFVMIISLFYILRDGKKFSNFLINASPLKTSDELSIYHTFRDTGKAVFYGSGASAVAQGILGGIAFFFAGLPAPVLWGTLMGFLGLIPFLGPFIIFVPAGIYLFLTGDIVTAIIFLLYNIVIVSTVDNIIKPKIIGDKVQLHPLLVLVSILGALQFFGVAGLLYGPLILAIFLALLKVYLLTEKSSTHTPAL